VTAFRSHVILAASTIVLALSEDACSSSSECCAPGRPHPEALASGSSVPTLAFDGYVEPAARDCCGPRPPATSYPFRPWSFQDLRTTARRYAIVQAAAAWCATCRPVAAGLSQAARSVREEGGDLVTILVDGSTPDSAPTRATLDEWISGTSTSITAVIDSPDSALAAKGELGYGNTFVVDLTTMTVLFVQHDGYDDALAFLHARLAEP
jgi:hypothetical protein